jgi:hypothetical protein
MENLNIEATKYTPHISLNSQTKIFDIIGKSYPENTFEFYKPVITWVEEFLKTISDEKITINLDLEYLNSSSLKAYFDLFDILEVAHDNGKSIEVKWIYDKENDIAEETGEDFIEDFESLNIELVTKS